MAPRGLRDFLSAFRGRRTSPASRLFGGRGLLVIAVIAVPLVLAVWATRRYQSGLRPLDAVGRPVPSFVLDHAGGGQTSSAELAMGKLWSLVVFWTTSCVECREEAPELKRLVEAPAKSVPPFRVVSINIGDLEKDVAAWMADFQMPFPALLDRAQTVAHDFGVTGVPETFFVDPHGMVKHRAVGGISAEEAERILEVLAQELAAAENSGGKSTP